MTRSVAWKTRTRAERRNRAANRHTRRGLRLWRFVRNGGRIQWVLPPLTDDERAGLVRMSEAMAGILAARGPADPWLP